MDHNLRIVLVDPEKGGPKATYIGTDAVKAQKAFDTAAADDSNEAVRLFIYPRHSSLRQPAEEAASIALQQKQSKEAAEAARTAEADAVKARLAAAEAELELAKAAHKELTPSKEK